MTAAHTSALLDARRLTLESLERAEAIGREYGRRGELLNFMAARAAVWHLTDAAAGLARLIAATGGERQGNV